MNLSTQPSQLANATPQLAQATSMVSKVENITWRE